MSLLKLMSVVPSQKFFQRYSYNHILNALGVNCNSRKTSFASTCPKCRKSCWIYGLMPFGGWFNCEYCGLRGDPVRVFGQVYRLDSSMEIRKALEQEFRSSGSMSEDWERYDTFYRNYYNLIERFWKTAQHNAANWGQPYHARRLYNLGLWRDQRTFNACMKDIVGVVHKGQFIDLFGEEPFGAKTRSFTRMMVMPFYQVPGFISGFALLGDKDLIRYVKTVPEHFGGFFNLNNAGNGTKETFVVDSPLQVLQVALKSEMEKVEFPPIVSAFPTQIVDWTGVSGTVSYWHDDPEPENLRKFLTARNCTMVESVCPPEWPTDKKRSGHWEESLAPKIIKSLNKAKKKTGVKFCVDHILNLKAGAKEYINRLNPTVQIKRLLLSKCKSTAKKKIEALFDDIDMVDSVQLKGKIVYEKDGRWWSKSLRHKRGDADELISEVILVIDTVYRSTKSDYGTYAGYLVFDNVKIEFSVDTKELQKNPRDYIELICAHAGIETLPYVSDWAKTNMVKVAELLRPPNVTKVQTTVGFDSMTGKFYLPHTLISSKGIEVGGRYVDPSADLPGAKIGQQLEVRHVDESNFNAQMLKNWLMPHYECVGYWATISSLMYTISSRISDKTTTGLALVGDKGSLAEHLFNIIRYDFDLLKSDLKDYKQNKIAMNSADHHLPLAIDGLRCKRPSLNRWLDRSCGPNTVLLIDPLYASSMGPDPDWVFIRAETRVIGEDPVLAGTESAVASFLQYMMLMQPQTLEAAFDNSIMVTQKLETNTVTIDRAKKMTSENGAINARSELAGFMSLVDEMLGQGLIEDGKEIVVSKEDDTVLLDVNKISKAVKKANLYPRRWALRSQLELFGFKPLDNGSAPIYSGSYKVWDRLMGTVIRLKVRQARRDRKFAK
jgi:hypothetical protein